MNYEQIKEGKEYDICGLNGTGTVVEKDKNGKLNNETFTVLLHRSNPRDNEVEWFSSDLLKKLN